LTEYRVKCNCPHGGYGCNQDRQFEDGRCAWCNHRWHRIHPIRRMFEKSVSWLFRLSPYGKGKELFPYHTGKIIYDWSYEP
jgi:hypothetical protein